MADHEHDHDHDHEHEHGHDHEQAPHPRNEDDDLVLTRNEARFLALKSILVEKGHVTLNEIRARMEFDEQGGSRLAGGIVARAWVDAAYKARLLQDAKSAAQELGVTLLEPQIVALENTPTLHNMVVCTLCSCYPRSLLGEPPSFYVSKAYRSRAVREPRKVLHEFGIDLPDHIEIRVHDSTADLRYMVIPMQPEGTEGLSEEALALLVSRDCLVGCALPGSSPL